MLSRDAGRRVFSHQRGRGNLTIRAKFQQLGAGDGTTTLYNFEKRGNEIRIFVERAESDEEKARRSIDDWDSEEDDNARAERWHRELSLDKARFSWRTLKDNDASSITTAPDGYSRFDQTRFPYDEDDNSAQRDERALPAVHW